MKTKKKSIAEIYCGSLESEGINYRESSIWLMLDANYYLPTVGLSCYKPTKWWDQSHKNLLLLLFLREYGKHCQENSLKFNLLVPKIQEITVS